VIVCLSVACIALFGGLLLTRRELEASRRTFYEFLETHAVETSLTEPVAPFEIAVVMPAYDEADNLPELLPRAPAEVGGHALRIVLVDDGSSDGTADLARKLGAIVVRSPINVGGGFALHLGFRAARRLGARWVVTLDADGQHRFEDLPQVLEPLFAGRADVVVGSRRLGQSVGHETFRSVGLSLFNTVLSVLTRRRVTDCSSGFRGLDLEALGRLCLVQRRHHTAELLIDSAHKGLRVTEVPITILPRSHGESKKGTNLLYGARFAWTIVSTALRRTS
jgi:glycosyltransferase involved in cell wall biosynthesis